MLARFVRLAVLLTSLAALPACASSTDANGGNNDTNEEDFKVSDYAEDSVLPYEGAWLDSPKALAGVGQFDRLRGTIYDDAKCSTMVAIAAAIVGGEERFVRFIDAVARLREGKRDDMAVIARVREAVAEKRLTPRHLHELTEATVRAYGVGNGAFDEQIAKMVRASGYVPVKVGSKDPTVLVDSLQEREVVPLGVVSENIPHITLLWKDARGTVRLYDSDDLAGGHVMPRGSKRYNAMIADPQSSWELKEKYR